MDPAQLHQFLAQNNFPEFRYRQIVKNYYSGRYSDYSDMSDISKDLRQQLADLFPLYSTKLSSLQTNQSTQKALLSLKDGLQIETVLMDYEDWLTACISTQVGCSLGCRFCATGQMGFKRDLSSEEIIDQIIFWKHKISPLSKGEAPAKAGERDLKVGRVVFMGMGEPFLNWENLVSALKIINSKDGLNIGQRKISISTAGLPQKIMEFADLNTEINLAISLHSLDQKIREYLMPIAKQYPLRELLKACQYYTSHTRRQLFLEYALVKDQNDSPRHLKLIIDLLKSNNLFFLNLIPLNPTSADLSPSDPIIQKHFEIELQKNHLNFSVRRSFGQDISAACGQLASRN
ncbi:MAG: 23S rRNA (adenine(2503)-C(2))-methyltransferase RlmN [Candidatus Shapirobacteria bacterium]